MNAFKCIFANTFLRKAAVSDNNLFQILTSIKEILNFAIVVLFNTTISGKRMSLLLSYYGLSA